jgi:hypothetical protein
MYKTMYKEVEVDVDLSDFETDDLIEEFDKLSIEEKITKDPDVLARIDNERINLNDIIEDLLEKINGIMNKILH